MSRGVLAVVDQAVISLASFLVTIIIGRSTAPEQLGMYTLAASGFWLLAGFPNALLWTPYTSRAPRLPSARRARYAGSVLIHLAILTGIVVAALGASAFALFLAERSSLGAPPASGDFSGVCLALAPFTVMMLLREHMRRTYIAHLQMQDLLKMDLPFAVAQMLLLWLMARSGWLSASTALLAIATACLWPAFALMSHWRRFRFHKRSVALHFAYNLRFGGWLVAASVAWLLSENFFRWFVLSCDGLRALGQMAAAFQVVLLVNPLFVSTCYFMRAVLANQLAQVGVVAVRRSVLVATLLMAIVFGIMLALLALFGGRLVVDLYGDSFVGQQSVVAAFCLGMFFRAVVVPVDAALIALRRGRGIALAAVVQLALAVAAGVPLIYLYGAIGVGYAMAISECGSLLVRWLLFAKDDVWDDSTGSPVP